MFAFSISIRSCALSLFVIISKRHAHLYFLYYKAIYLYLHLQPYRHSFRSLSKSGESCEFVAEICTLIRRLERSPLFFCHFTTLLYRIYAAISVSFRLFRFLLALYLVLAREGLFCAHTPLLYCFVAPASFTCYGSATLCDVRHGCSTSLMDFFFLFANDSSIIYDINAHSNTFAMCKQYSYTAVELFFLKLVQDSYTLIQRNRTRHCCSPLSSHSCSLIRRQLMQLLRILHSYIQQFKLFIYAAFCVAISLIRIHTTLVYTEICK